jgi:hypothetical protein
LSDNNAAEHETTDDEVPAQADPDPAEQMKHLNELREQGILTEEEFVAEKNTVLGTP